jgi:hypothetical protein
MCSANRRHWRYVQHEDMNKDMQAQSWYHRAPPLRGSMPGIEWGARGVAARGVKTRFARFKDAEIHYTERSVSRLVAGGVWLTCACPAAGDREQQALGYRVQVAYLRLLCRLDRPPERQWLCRAGRTAAGPVGSQSSL